MTRVSVRQAVQADGYNLDKWSTVRDMAALEGGDYDLVLLDLHGGWKS